MSVRAGRFKLHYRATGESRFPPNQTDWIDPRGPDGVTLLAPYEQYQPIAYPGLRSGDESVDRMLIDLEADPAEQHDVAAKYPDVVGRLSATFRRMQAEFDAEMADAANRNGNQFSVSPRGQIVEDVGVPSGGAAVAGDEEVSVRWRRIR